MERDYLLCWEGDTSYIPSEMPVDTREAVIDEATQAMPMGQGVGAIKRIMPAEEIVKEMMRDAAQALTRGATLVVPSRL